MEKIKFKTRILRKISKLTGYFIFKKRHAPVGYDLFIDLRHKLLLPMEVVFDVGANIGQTALAVAKEFPKAEIYSFEPVQKTFDQLKINTQPIRLIQYVHSALGEQNERIEIRLFPDDESVCNTLNVNAMNQDANAAVETIKVMKGETFCSNVGIKHIDLLKIDTEGFERQVIRGFSNFMQLGMIEAVLAEVSFNPQDKTHTYINDFNDLMLGFGFHFYGLYDISNASIKVGRSFSNALYVSSGRLEKLVC